MPPSSAQAYQTLTDYGSTRKKTEDIYKESQDKYDIGGFTSRLSNMRGLVGNLQSSVEAVDPSVTGRTSGSFVSEGQRQALVSKERAPILGDLGKQQQALGQESEAYNVATGLASQLAGAKISEDQNTYQRLLDQYNAAKTAEAAAEEKRRWEAQQAEQVRQFNLQLEESRKAAAASAAAAKAASYNIGGASAAAKSVAPSVQDQAYQSVQAYLSQGKQRAESDFAATLASANRGNAMDKLKVQLYRQNGIGLGYVNQSGKAITSGSGTF